MSDDGSYDFSAAPSPDELARFEASDLGNAMRLILIAGGKVRPDGEVDATGSRLLFVLGRGWIGYDGQRFDFKYGDDLARRMAHKVAHQTRALYDQWVPDKMDAKAFFKFADGCGSAGATSAMLRQAQSYLTVDIEVFDRDPLALNCRNGTVRMRWSEAKGFSARLEPHDPKHRITRITAAAFDPKAPAPRFLQVVEDSLPDLAWRDYLHRCLGYCATGLVSEQAFFVCQGRGRDGKSTILDACREALGDYGEVGDVASFLENRNANSGGPSPDLVKLSGDVRLCVLSEPPRGTALAEGRLKAWTSGSPITARDLNSKNFNFRPIAKLVWEMNAWSPVKDDSDGIWRRIHPVLFERQVPIDKLDRDLPNHIRSHELAGVIAWLVRGVEAWITPVEKDGRRSRGLRPPKRAEQAVSNYRRETSPFGDWLAERCVTHGSDGDGKPERTLAKELFADFKAWMEEQGHEKVMSIRAFGDALRARQIDVMGKNSAGLKYRGPIRLKTPAELSADQAAAEAALAAMNDLSSAGGHVAGPDLGGAADEIEEDPFS